MAEVANTKLKCVISSALVGFAAILHGQALASNDRDGAGLHSLAFTTDGYGASFLIERDNSGAIHAWAADQNMNIKKSGLVLDMNAAGNVVRASETLPQGIVMLEIKRGVAYFDVIAKDPKDATALKAKFNGDLERAHHDIKNAYNYLIEEPSGYLSGRYQIVTTVTAPNSSNLQASSAEPAPGQSASVPGTQNGMNEQMPSTNPMAPSIVSKAVPPLKAKAELKSAINSAANVAQLAETMASSVASVDTKTVQSSTPSTPALASSLPKGGSSQSTPVLSPTVIVVSVSASADPQATQQGIDNFDYPGTLNLGFMGAMVLVVGAVSRLGKGLHDYEARRSGMSAAQKIACEPTFTHPPSFPTLRM